MGDAEGGGQRASLKIDAALEIFNAKDAKIRKVREGNVAHVSTQYIFLGKAGVRYARATLASFAFSLRPLR